MQQGAQKFISVSGVCALMNSRKTRGRKVLNPPYFLCVCLSKSLVPRRLLLSSVPFLTKTWRLEPVCGPQPSEYEGGIGTTFLGGMDSVLHAVRQMEHEPSDGRPGPPPPPLTACQGAEIRLCRDPGWTGGCSANIRKPWSPKPDT